MTTSTKRRSPVLRRAHLKGPSLREISAQATRESILKAAIKVFAKGGYDGGRIEQISKAAKSYDRMIYYYFGSKEQLFIEVIEEVYRRFNDAESELNLNLGEPVESLQAVIHFIWTYYQKNPEFIALLNNENLHRGKHIPRSLREYSSPAIGVLERVLHSGAQRGVFRRDISARDLYLMIASLAYFYLSNRFTLSAFLGEDLAAPTSLAHWEAFVTDAVLRTLKPGNPKTTS